ncbi:MAG: hypothetical protein O3C21_05795 [Verrucomicrobia bacterium]|nr:hypothetical protein [Verrucomicrobiota bacterium]
MKYLPAFRSSAPHQISPNDPDTPDYVIAFQEGDEHPKLDQFYIYRIVNENRFTP